MAQLSDRQVDAFDRYGFLFPLTAFTGEEAADIRQAFETQQERASEHPDLGPDWIKSFPHFVSPVLDRVIRHPEIVDSVSSILGDDLLVWGCTVFAKSPLSQGFVGWHQDLHYWGLSEEDEVTAWLALSPATVESGCMRFVPGSHRKTVQHIDRDDEDAMLSRGQELAVAVDEAEAEDIILRPGEYSLHHGRTFHASAPNRSEDWRIGVAVRYIKTSMHQTGHERAHAVLVRGEDRYGYFELFDGPKDTFDADDMAIRAAAIEVNAGINFR